MPTLDCALDADARAAHAAFQRTLYGAAGAAGSAQLAALGKAACSTHATALRDPASRSAWETFAAAVAAFLDELDAHVGLALDDAAIRARHDLRDILYENSDLVG
jgi:hypothetical protein